MKRTTRPEFFEVSDIQSNFSRITELLGTGVFHDPNKVIFAESAFTEILLRLNDLIQNLKRYDQHPRFKDDMPTGVDISELVNNFRGALSHPSTSRENYVEKKQSIKATFNRAMGKVKLAKISDIELISEYEDDIAFFYGNNRIYLKRDIVRALLEMMATFEKWESLPST